MKTLTFTFEPKRVRGVDYTIKEVITMKDGDSFMRKRLDISVGEGQAEKAKIDYIDLENMQMSQDDLKKMNTGRSKIIWQTILTWAE